MKTRDKEIVKKLVEKKIQTILKDWLPFRSLPVHVKFFEGGRTRAYVSWHSFKNGKGIRVCDKSQLDLYLNESSFLDKKVSKRSLYATICHEAYHIIQRNIYSYSDLKALGNQTVSQNLVTSYCHNELELQAEVFAINLCGSSNHSYKNAKSQPLYREVLSEILNCNSL